MRRASLLVLLLACGPSASPRPAYVAVPAQPAPVATAAPSKPPAPIAVAPARAVPTIVRLSVGEEPCGLDADGRVWRWSDAKMRAEDGVSFPDGKAVACGIGHACVIARDDTLWCWGGNGYGELGDGTTTARSTPVRVATVLSVAEVGVAGGRTCARTVGGHVFCWGDSEFGKAGDGRLPDNSGREKPRIGASILENATALFVGPTCACALSQNDKLSCWGQNQGGSCGHPPSMRYIARPHLVAPQRDVRTMALSTPVACAIDHASKVACWGSEGNKPRAVPLPGPAEEVAAGDRFACARLVDGTVHCWGVNSDGQLGDGTNVDRNKPVQVRGVTGATRIAIGINSVCALLPAGRVTCWGEHMAEDGGTAKKPTEVVPEAM